MGLLTCLMTCIQATKEARDFNEQLRRDGLKMAVKQCSKDINNIIHSQDIAIKFILQELDFSQKEKALPTEFIRNSGFHHLEYEGASEMFQENKTDLVQIQTLFDNFLRKIKNEKEVMQVSIHLIEQIMDEWKIGKYSPITREEKEEIPQQPIIQEPVDIPPEINIIPEEEEPKILKMQYDSNRVNQLMEEYSDIIGDIIMGMNNPNEEHRIEIFKEHISLASIEGQSHHARVLSCFYEHHEPYNLHLPIPLKEMSGESLSFFKSIIQSFSKQGFSQEFLTYIDNNKEDTHLIL